MRVSHILLVLYALCGTPSLFGQEPFSGKLVNLDESMELEYLPSDSVHDEIELTNPLQLEDGRKLRLPRLRHAAHHRYSDYRSDESSFSYLPGSGDSLGWLSFETSHYQRSGYRSGISTSFGFQVLDGPISVDLPPRLYDFGIGYQHRGKIDESFSYDVSTSVGVYSDFEGSARDGIRYLSHAAGMLHVSPEMDWVFGVDYLDRDDIALLPIVGISRHSERMQAMRFDLVFPRPQIEIATSSGRTVYLAGRLGGGSWDIEFPTQQADVVTYRDYRLLLGIRSPRAESASSVEFGYVFGRKVDFRGISDSVRPDDAFVLRFVTIR
jgi:hypothetical protein